MAASGSRILSDGSSTIATGGTAQALFARNELRTGYSVYNASAGNLFVNDVGGTAVTSGGSSFTIAPGVLYESPPGARPIQAISIIGATTSQAFVAREW